MTKAWPLACVLAALAANPAPAADGPPADFKLVIHVFGVGKSPLASADLVVRKGVAYQFMTEAADEVMIIDPAQGRMMLLDLGRKVQTEVTAVGLDNALARLHRRLTATVAAREKTGKRADRVEASMTRDLIDPKFTERFDPATNRLRLTNGSVEVDAVGEPEPDPARLIAIVNALAAVAKHDTLREPEALPPFARLAAFRALAAQRGLRPTEITLLFRLAGPPKKQRWTYRLVTSLTDREREAISRVDRLRETAAFVGHDAYERPVDR